MDLRILMIIMKIIFDLIYRNDHISDIGFQIYQLKRGNYETNNWNDNVGSAFT